MDARQKLRGLWVIQPRGLTGQCFDKRGGTRGRYHRTAGERLAGPAEQKIFRLARVELSRKGRAF